MLSVSRLAAFANTAAAAGERPVPGVRVALLGADMERDAIGFEARPMGVLQHVRGHAGSQRIGRQRPFRPDAIREDAAEDARAGGGPGDLLHLGRAVDANIRTPERIARATSRSFLDGVAEGDAVRLAPAASTISISADRGVSKLDPSAARSDSTSGRRFAFTA